MPRLLRDDPRMNALTAICRESEVCACLSSPFTQLAKRQDFVAQAKRILDFAPAASAAPILLADDYYFEYIADRIHSKYSRETLQITALSFLDSFDRANHTRYLETLEVYLSCFNNAAQAAKLLFIDRSTLKYRIRKIGEILQFDLDEPHNALNLRIGIRIYRALARLE